MNVRDEQVMRELADAIAAEMGELVQRQVSIHGPRFSVPHHIPIPFLLATLVQVTCAAARVAVTSEEQLVEMVRVSWRGPRLPPAAFEAVQGGKVNGPGGGTA